MDLTGRPLTSRGTKPGWSGGSTARLFKPMSTPAWRAESTGAGTGSCPRWFNSPASSARQDLHLAKGGAGLDAQIAARARAAEREGVVQRDAADAMPGYLHFAKACAGLDVDAQPGG